jgi:hypothetical protein
VLPFHVLLSSSLCVHERLGTTPALHICLA